MLIIDDMTLIKAGDQSVGVARQYSGKAGKRENCQALVSITLAKREVPVPIGLRLFLPQEWTRDEHRCNTAGIPHSRRVHKSKGRIALAEIDRVLDAGVKADVVEKSGSWFSYNSERIGQGRENAKQFMRDHPEMAAEIERAIRQNAGLVAEEMLTGENEKDGDDVDAAEAS